MTTTYYDYSIKDYESGATIEQGKFRFDYVIDDCICTEYKIITNKDSNCLRDLLSTTILEEMTVFAIIDGGASSDSVYYHGDDYGRDIDDLESTRGAVQFNFAESD